MNDLKIIRDNLLKENEYRTKSFEEFLAYSNGVLDMYNEILKEKEEQCLMG